MKVVAPKLMIFLTLLAGASSTVLSDPSLQSICPSRSDGVSTFEHADPLLQDFIRLMCEESTSVNINVEKSVETTSKEMSSQIDTPRVEVQIPDSKSAEQIQSQFLSEKSTGISGTKESVQSDFNVVRSVFLDSQTGSNMRRQRTVQVGPPKPQKSKDLQVTRSQFLAN